MSDCATIYSIVGTKYCGAAAAALMKAAKPGCPITLRRDPGNPHDSYAVKVEIKGTKVGFIKREHVKDVAVYMDENGLEIVDAFLCFIDQWPHAQVSLMQLLERERHAKSTIPTAGPGQYATAKDAKAEIPEAPNAPISRPASRR